MYTEKHVNLLIEYLKGDETSLPGVGPLAKTDFKEMVELANRQCVSPLLYRKMAIHSNQIPREVLKELCVTYYKYAARSMILYNEFTKIFEMLHGEGIPFIVLKGVHLGEIVYGDTALRPISDLDLLIKQDDIERIAEAFRRLGYAPDQSDGPNRARHHLPPFLKTGAVPVELHWDIDGERITPSDKMEELWRRARWECIGGANVLVLSTEDLLLHLSLHAALHHFSLKLISLYDIREILGRRSHEIAWDQVLSIAGQWKATKALYLTLCLAHDILAAQVPRAVLIALKPPDFNEWYLLSAKEEVFAETKLISESLAQMYASQKMWERLKIIYRRFFPSEEFMRSVYAGSKSDWIYFYYLVRFLELSGRYGRILCQMVLKRREGLILPDPSRRKALHNWLFD